MPQPIKIRHTKWYAAQREKLVPFYPKSGGVNQMSKESPKPAEASQTLNDAYPRTMTENLLLEIIEQNEEIIQLLEIMNNNHLNASATSDAAPIALPPPERE